VSVIQDPGASSSFVVPAVRKVLDQLAEEYPGVHFKSAYDNSHFVSILFHNVWEELGLAILLTAVALLFFLGEWRGTLIAPITLPTSLAMAVLMMVPLGMTFNSGTLMAPLLFSGGITQLMFVELVWPIIFGLLASMIVSFTLTALLCASWLRHEEEREADRRHPALRWLYVPLDPFQRFLEQLEAGYAWLVAWMLKNRFTNF